MDFQDNEAQTSPKQVIANAFHTLKMQCDGPVDEPTQTTANMPATAEVATQAGHNHLDGEVCEAEVQVEWAQHEYGVQAGSSALSAPVEAQTQTRTMRVENVSTQAVASAAEVAVQAIPAQGAPMACQTDTEQGIEHIGAEVQAGCPAANCHAVGAQTEEIAQRPCADAACEAAITIPPKEIVLCSAASQTSTAGRSMASVQTVKIQKATAASQATPPAPTLVDCSTQVEEETDSAQRAAEKQTRLEKLEARMQQLTCENERLAVQNRDLYEKAQAFQQVAQTKALGQMNVTILCPRAECTVGGERVEMDSWNPGRLREEFEREVLPRFTRVFVDESVVGQNRVRSEAVDKAMQDFAETFRERLSTMLSAPNAAAAVQAAAAAKSTRSGR
jgi:hypothetical protein